MIWITTDRGKVKVIGKECATRPCLHVHWSRFAQETKDVKSGPYKGGRAQVYPLVCVRNEEHGCPHPLPDPR